MPRACPEQHSPHADEGDLRLLVVGGSGMLGHQLVRQLAPGHDVAITLRGSPVAQPLASVQVFGDVDVRRTEILGRVIRTWRPDAVVNAAGLVRQRAEALDEHLLGQVNGVVPHQLAALCREAGARLLHVSTDCVFSGRRGLYSEQDVPDPVDAYGRSKLEGEPRGAHCLTLRTSFIGPELVPRGGLLEWFLAQRGPVRGYTKAIFSGFTTRELSRRLERLLVGRPHLAGIWHLASPPISKHDLLVRIARLLRHPAVIEPDESVVCDRSLDGSALSAATGEAPPEWEAMLEELADDIAARERTACC